MPFAKDKNGNDLISLTDCGQSQSDCDSCTNLSSDNYCQSLGYTECDNNVCTLMQDEP